MTQITAHPPAFQSPPAVLGLIALLAVIHAALWYAGPDWQVWSLYALAFIPARFTDIGFPLIPGSQVWSFLTYAFLHGDWMHLIFNCLWLLVFGTPVARYFGAWRFLLLSAVAAVFGAAVMLALHWGVNLVMVGASGAVSGLMAAAVPIMYGAVRPLPFAELIRNRRAIMFTLVWLAITLFSGASGFTGNSFMEEGGIAWEAHVGGFIAGLAAFYLLHARAVHS